jgi:hypothetical protein
MPFKLATIGRQRSLATLARGLYALKDSPGMQERAEAALLRANPVLAGEAPPPAGTVLVVPEIPGLAAEAARAATPPPDAQPLEEFGAALEALLPRLERELGGELRVLQSPEFARALFSRRPDLDAVLPEIVRAANEDAEAAILHGQQVREAVEHALADRKRLPG